MRFSHDCDDLFCEYCEADVIERDVLSPVDVFSACYQKVEQLYFSQQSLPSVGSPVCRWPWQLMLIYSLTMMEFSYMFSKVQEHSDVHWNFQQYVLIAEYHSRPCLAPPFITISHLHLFIKRNIHKVPSFKIKHLST
ncbi:hypothetical protein AOLI_G00171560 [Acnodon oligacanthus]